MSSQVRLSSQLNLGANLNKRKRKIFVINFGRNFVIFVKNLPAWHFLLLLSIFLMSALVRLSAESKQAPTQKLLFLNKRSERLIGHSRYA